MEHAPLVDRGDRARRKPLLVVYIAIYLLHQIRLGDAAVERRVADRRHQRGRRRGARRQPDRRRDLACDLLDLKECEIKTGSLLDVADTVDSKDLLVLSTDFLQQIDRYFHLAIEPGLKLEPIASHLRELVTDVKLSG